MIVCQTNDAAKSGLELMEELHRLREEKAEHEFGTSKFSGKSEKTDLAYGFHVSLSDKRFNTLQLHGN